MNKKVEVKIKALENVFGLSINSIPSKAEQLPKAIKELTKEIRTQRAKILEEFGIAYLADTKLKPSQVIMYEQADFANGKVRWWFERKK